MSRIIQFLKLVAGVRIKVTQEDIQAGIPGNCTECAIALALKRKLDSKYECTVDREGIHTFVRDSTYSNSEWQEHAHSNKTLKFMRAFDQSKYPENKPPKI